jgi:hypothetical protein
MQCSPVKIDRRLGRTYHSFGCAWFLCRAAPMRGSFFDPEDGGGMFPRNVGWLSLVYTALYPEDGTVKIKLSMCSAPCNEDIRGWQVRMNSLLTRYCGRMRMCCRFIPGEVVSPLYPFVIRGARSRHSNGKKNAPASLCLRSPGLSAKIRCNWRSMFTPVKCFDIIRSAFRF